MKNGEGQRRERDDDREKASRWRRVVFEQSEKMYIDFNLETFIRNPSYYRFVLVSR